MVTGTLAVSSITVLVTLHRRTHMPPARQWSSNEPALSAARIAQRARGAGGVSGDGGGGAPVGEADASVPRSCLQSRGRLDLFEQRHDSPVVILARGVDWLLPPAAALLRERVQVGGLLEDDEEGREPAALCGVVEDVLTLAVDEERAHTGGEERAHDRVPA